MAPLPPNAPAAARAGARPAAERRVARDRRARRAALDEVDVVVAVDVAQPQPRTEAHLGARRALDHARAPAAQTARPAAEEVHAPVLRLLPGRGDEQVVVAVLVEVVGDDAIAVAVRPGELEAAPAGQAVPGAEQDRDAVAAGRPDREVGGAVAVEVAAGEAGAELVVGARAARHPGVLLGDDAPAVAAAEHHDAARHVRAARARAEHRGHELEPAVAVEVVGHGRLPVRGGRVRRLRLVVAERGGEPDRGDREQGERAQRRREQPPPHRRLRRRREREASARAPARSPRRSCRRRPRRAARHGRRSGS